MPRSKNLPEVSALSAMAHTLVISVILVHSMVNNHCEATNHNVLMTQSTAVTECSSLINSKYQIKTDVTYI